MPTGSCAKSSDHHHVKDNFVCYSLGVVFVILAIISYYTIVPAKVTAEISEHSSIATAFLNDLSLKAFAVLQLCEVRGWKGFQTLFDDPMSTWVETYRRLESSRARNMSDQTSQVVNKPTVKADYLNYWFRSSGHGKPCCLQVPIKYSTS